MDHDFPIDQLIAEASTLRGFDGITTAMWIALHEVRAQDAQVRPVHPRGQVARLELDFGVNTMWTARMEDPCKYRARRVGDSTAELMLMSRTINMPWVETMRQADRKRRG
ncbi:MAG TPA: hypothetical protein VMA74_05380 [Dyella sp.]|uniref:hypothetical protein n=1 Tax=Dyella sp. TaxID=1869338 RepID=UPI002C7A9C8F|nr:hypothetical protein [Dyella sp.]HUB89146.1 hypothetical protein [Dyella sp.]